MKNETLHDFTSYICTVRLCALGKLFKDYKPVELEIWHTFTDTTMKELI